MKQNIFKLSVLLIVTSLLAITIAIASFFIKTEEVALPYIEPIDTATYSPKQLTPEQAMVSLGEILFKENCKTCHSFHTQEVGPALYGVSNRRSKKWIRQFIRNNQILVQRKDTAAINLIKKFDYSPHTTFESLTNKEIDRILLYIDDQPYAVPLVQPEIISCP